MSVRILSRPRLGLSGYHVVVGSDPSSAPEVAARAMQLGAQLARSRYGDGGGFVVLSSGGEARRRPWPHAHVVPVRGVAHKRWVLFALLLKRWLPARFRAPRTSAGRV